MKFTQVRYNYASELIIIMMSFELEHYHLPIRTVVNRRRIRIRSFFFLRTCFGGPKVGAGCARYITPSVGGGREAPPLSLEVR
jgi:hypothetical protein